MGFYLWTGKVYSCITWNCVTFRIWSEILHLLAKSYMERVISEMSHEKIWTWLWKENFKWETQYILIAAQTMPYKPTKLKRK